SAAVTAYEPDLAALRARDVVVLGGIESRGTITWRTAEVLADALGRELVVFPSHHGGFLGGEFGQQGEPEAFAARLHEVLAGAREPSAEPPRSRDPARAKCGQRYLRCWSSCTEAPGVVSAIHGPVPSDWSSTPCSNHSTSPASTARARRRSRWSVLSRRWSN